MTHLHEFEDYLISQCHLADLTVAAYKSDVSHFLKTHQANPPDHAAIIAFLNQLHDNEYAKKISGQKNIRLNHVLSVFSI